MHKLVWRIQLGHNFWANSRLLSRPGRNLSASRSRNFAQFINRTPSKKKTPVSQHVHQAELIRILTGLTSLARQPALIRALLSPFNRGRIVVVREKFSYGCCGALQPFVGRNYIPVGFLFRRELIRLCAHSGGVMTGRECGTCASHTFSPKGWLLLCIIIVRGDVWGDVVNGRWFVAEIFWKFAG